MRFNPKHPLVRRIGKTAALAFVCFLLFYLAARKAAQNTPDDTLSQCMFSTMSTSGMMTFYHPDEKQNQFKSLSDALLAEMKHVESLCNIFDGSSELARLNATAFREPFRCSDDLWEILLIARRYYDLSDGAFDVTMDPLRTLWNFARGQQRLPNPDELQTALDKVGLNKVVFDEKTHTVQFLRDGMAINLGGIAKGWALDRAAALLREKWPAFDCGYIDLGGNVLVLKQPRRGAPTFQAGVKNPFHPDQNCATLSLLDEAISTSGSYERYVVIDGKQYSHIVNPKTGLPVENILSVSVVAPNAVDADALSTAIFVHGPDFAAKMRDRDPRIRILILRRPPGKPDEVESFPFGDGWACLPIAVP